MTAQEIVEYYYKQANIKRVLPAFKQASIRSVEMLLNNNTSEEIIINALQYYIDNHTKYADKPSVKINDIIEIEDIKEMLNIEEEENLIEQNKIYYHKRLRNMPSAPIKVFDKETFEFKTVAPEMYIKIIKKITREDIVKYFYQVHEIPELARSLKRDIAGLNYIIENCKKIMLPQNVNIVDLILYMIDVSRRCSEQEGRRIKNLIEINDYIEEAIELLIDKINHEKINNIKVQFE